MRIFFTSRQAQAMHRLFAPHTSFLLEQCSLEEAEYKQSDSCGYTCSASASFYEELSSPRRRSVRSDDNYLLRHFPKEVEAAWLSDMITSEATR
eukprot:scaffold13325_cov112-Skeletonema_marinoi.AAC.3